MVVGCLAAAACVCLSQRLVHTGANGIVKVAARQFQGMAVEEQSAAQRQDNPQLPNSAKDFLVRPSKEKFASLFGIASPTEILATDTGPKSSVSTDQTGSPAAVKGVVIGACLLVVVVNLVLAANLSFRLPPMPWSSQKTPVAARLAVEDEAVAAATRLAVKDEAIAAAELLVEAQPPWLSSGPDGVQELEEAPAELVDQLRTSLLATNRRIEAHREVLDGRLASEMRLSATSHRDTMASEAETLGAARRGVGDADRLRAQLAEALDLEKRQCQRIAELEGSFVWPSLSTEALKQHAMQCELDASVQLPCDDDEDQQPEEAVDVASRRTVPSDSLPPGSIQDGELSSSSASDRLNTPRSTPVKSPRNHSELDSARALDSSNAERSVDNEPTRTGFVGVKIKETESGLTLSKVTADGPAARAGLKAGDVVVTVNKERMEDREGLENLIRRCQPGDVLTFGVTCQGKGKRTVKVTVGAASTDARESSGAKRASNSPRNVPVASRKSWSTRDVRSWLVPGAAERATR